LSVCLSVCLPVCPTTCLELSTWAQSSCTNRHELIVIHAPQLSHESPTENEQLGKKKKHKKPNKIIINNNYVQRGREEEVSNAYTYKTSHITAGQV